MIIIFRKNPFEIKKKIIAKYYESKLNNETL